MEAQREEAVRKGPWKPEEDEVLMNHVNKYGPRDWSSIRSKGLLQRTGKSCRLRWVNKLRPNLKSGCKFSPEEERIVIELQAQLGNKWARIAKYLQGRTDNDVKNFWSSRQKRLARIFQTQTTNPKSQKNKWEVHSCQNVATLEEGESSSKDLFCSLPDMDDFEIVQMIPVSNLVNQHLTSSSTNHFQVDYTRNTNHIQVDHTRNTNHIQVDYAHDQNTSSAPLSPIQVSQSDITLPAKCQDLLARLDDPDLYDLFGPEATDFGNGAHFLDEPLFMEPSGSYRGCQKDDDGDCPGTPNTFFDDFPMDLLDHIEPPPSPSR